MAVGEKNVMQLRLYKPHEHMEARDYAYFQTLI